MRYGNAKAAEAGSSGSGRGRQHMPAKRKISRRQSQDREKGRQEERGRRVQSSVAVSILAARRQSELEMSSQIGAARAAFMLHLCSPRNTLECKAKPDRGGQRERERGREECELEGSCEAEAETEEVA